jgi:hypothetical protein
MPRPASHRAMRDPWAGMHQEHCSTGVPRLLWHSCDACWNHAQIVVPGADSSQGARRHPPRLERPPQGTAVARHWRGTRSRLAMMTFLHLRELAQVSGLQIQRMHALLRSCHAQTFVVLTKISSTGERLRLDGQRDALPSPAVEALEDLSSPSPHFHPLLPQRLHLSP